MSARNVYDGLDKVRYEISWGFISRGRKWSFGPSLDDMTTSWSQREALGYLDKHRPDIVFIALHGLFGEDGELQALLDRLKIKYTGSSARVSRLVMDKLLSQEKIRQQGVLTIPSVSIQRSDWLSNPSAQLASAKQLSKKLLIKPNTGGSSIGIVSCGQADLPTAIEESLKNSEHILIQPLIAGREFSCGVVESGGKGKALPVTEIASYNSSSGFFDYESKYNAQKSEEITPAKLSEAQSRQIQDLALRCHNGFGCRGYSRTDFLLSVGKIYFLETNTLPGLTKNSILPKEAQVVGMDLGRLLDLIIAAGLK